MKKYKRELESALLRRSAHADVIEVGKNPQFLFLLFGGSGIDDEEYQKRSQTVIPLFDRVLESRGNAGNCFIFMHVTAPYDIPYNRFATELDVAFLWSSHVREELIEPWSGLPMFVSGFSGGAALAPQLLGESRNVCHLLARKAYFGSCGRSLSQVMDAPIR